MYNVHYIYNELVKDFCFVLFINTKFRKYYAIHLTKVYCIYYFKVIGSQRESK